MPQTAIYKKHHSAVLFVPATEEALQNFLRNENEGINAYNFQFSTKG